MLKTDPWVPELHFPVRSWWDSFLLPASIFSCSVGRGSSSSLCSTHLIVRTNISNKTKQPLLRYWAHRPRILWCLQQLRDENFELLLFILSVKVNDKTLSKMTGKLSVTAPIFSTRGSRALRYPPAPNQPAWVKKIQKYSYFHTSHDSNCKLPTAFHMLLVKKKLLSYTEIL